LQFSTKILLYLNKDNAPVALQSGALDPSYNSENRKIKRAHD